MEQAGLGNVSHDPTRSRGLGWARQDASSTPLENMQSQEAMLLLHGQEFLVDMSKTDHAKHAKRQLPSGLHSWVI